jgi:hypothetical protein
MRQLIVAAAATLAAVLVCLSCLAAAGRALATTAGPVPSTPPGSPAACYAFAVSALRRHEVVRRTPSACAGLGAEQVNLAAARAIHIVVGPLPKTAARRKALAEGRYLASLIRTVRPPLPASLAAPAAETPSAAADRAAALAAWLAAALAGAYLLAGRLRRGGRPALRALGIAGGHAGLAVAGLCLWLAFMVTAAPALGWIDVGLSWVLVGLGMATLLADWPGTVTTTGTGPPLPAAIDGGAVPGAQVPARPPVLVIALHGALATATIVLVLLAVVGTG